MKIWLPNQEQSHKDDSYSTDVPKPSLFRLET